MAPAVRPSTLRLALLVFGILSSLYLLTAGGQGYSVDGTFSYAVANSLANDPTHSFVRRNAETLRRWGLVVPLLGTPLTWLGARLGEAVPFRDSVALGDQMARLYDWPPIEPVGSSGLSELRLDLPMTMQQIRRVRLVTFLSYGADIADGTPVAELELLGSTGADTLVLGRARLLAGRDTAEWAYDLQGMRHPRHARARVAGHWPGNPNANLYLADLEILPGSTEVPASAIRLRSLMSSGRLHVRSASVLSSTGWIDLSGSPRWSGGDQEGFFSWFGFSFLNVPIVAAACALLMPLAVLLGYSNATAVLLALGAGISTMLWPYAKHDFSEPVVGFFLLSALVFLFAAHAAVNRRRQDVFLLLAGAGGALAVGTKYASLFVLPLLGAQLVLLWWPSRRVEGMRRFVTDMAWRVGVFCLPSAVAAAGALLLLGRLPILWASWRGGLERGWLDFPLWSGLYGLLISPGKSLFLYSPPLLLALVGAVLFFRRHRERAFIFLALPLA
ncbi:MAG TPA: phospholipid carrier-dependent glycosyltransferase, partial [Chloroflexota bacterium]|nr:phospholipid carrier-dependent glycosyltransferase [Chloroflexota bacterium]